MPYVQRNEQGDIICHYANKQVGFAEEWIAEGSPELTAKSKEVRLAECQAKYDLDRDKLNQAWLSALIADGAGEAARQAVIKSQMEELDAQLEMDIVAIIMGD